MQVVARIGWWLFALGGMLACSGGGEGVLRVNLRTDYLPVRDFVGVRTEIQGAEGEPWMSPYIPFADEDFVRGIRIAEMADPPTGRVEVRVTLLDGLGRTLAERVQLLEIDGRAAATVVITTSCESVECPLPGDAPSLEACLGGRCVDPRCSEETPEYCEEPECAADADCSSSVACAEGICREGICFVVGDESLCATGEVCDPLEGCVDASEPTDGGMPASDGGCEATETTCDDGVDDDCDGDVDCADSDCASSCAECATDAECGSPSFGSWSGCDYANGCDERASRSRSVMTPRCVDGACTVEASTENGTCTRDTDGTTCSDTVYGGWGACDYSGTCDQSATRYRSVTTYRCGGGSCNGSTSSQSDACSRSTTGDSCMFSAECPGECASGFCSPLCAPGCPC